MKFKIAALLLTITACAYSLDMDAMTSQALEVRRQIRRVAAKEVVVKDDVRRLYQDFVKFDATFRDACDQMTTCVTVRNRDGQLLQTLIDEVGGIDAETTQSQFESTPTKK